MFHSRHLRPLCAGAALALAILLAAPSAEAVREPVTDPLHAAAVAPPGFVATPAPRPLAEVAGALASAAAASYDAFVADHGPGWRIFVDRRSGAAALTEGPGIPWISGNGATLADLEPLARDLVRRYPGLFAATAAELVLDPAASGRFGERRPVLEPDLPPADRRRPGRGLARWCSGSATAAWCSSAPSGCCRAAPVSPRRRRRSPRPTRSPRVADHVGGLLPDDVVAEPGALAWVARGAGDEVGWTGPVGAGWTPDLVYRVAFLRAGSAATWHGAGRRGHRRGAALHRRHRLRERDQGLGLPGHQLLGAVGTACPATVAEVPVTLPDAKPDFVGDGSAGCYTNSAGAFDYPPLAVGAVTTLQGKYFTTIDACGPITVTGAGIRATSTPAPPGWCRRRSTPTASPARLGSPTRNRADQRRPRRHPRRAQRLLPPEPDQPEGALLPAGQRLAAGRRRLARADPAPDQRPAGVQRLLAGRHPDPGLLPPDARVGCNNTGEIAGVFLHEFGHGLDQNDGTGTAPESATGEAMGDTFALLQTQQSCVGSGFRLPDPSGRRVGQHRRLRQPLEALLGRARHRLHPLLPARRRRRLRRRRPTPTRSHGSRSGPNPPPEPAGEAGTPARWNHMIAHRHRPRRRRRPAPTSTTAAAPRPPAAPARSTTAATASR